MRSQRALSVLIAGVLTAAGGWVAVGAAQPTRDDRTEVVAVMGRIMDAFNKGDVAAFKAWVAEDVSLTDDMPPFHWSGPGAVDAWLADVDRDTSRYKDTDGFSVLGPPTFVRVEGDMAYASFPDQFSYKRNGRPVREKATLAVVFRKTAAGWRMTSVSYAADRH
jgi:ketosteroid isomerase-like protein